MRRLARYLAYGAAALALLALAAALALPMLLDRPGIVAQLQARLSRAVRGDVRWQEFSVRILPTPHGLLRGLRVETEAATFTTDEVTLALSLWPLLKGRAEITSLQVAGPSLRFTVVPAAEVPEEARLKKPQAPPEAYRSAMAMVAGALQDFAPDTVMEIVDGEVDLRIEGGPSFEAKQVNLHARTSEEGVQFDVTATSRFWTAMKIGGRIRYADLSSTADVQLARVQGQAWLDYALRETGVRVAVPDLDVSARFRALPEKPLELELDARAPTVTVTRGAQRFAIAPASLKATAEAGPEALGVRVAGLQAGETSIGDGTLRYALKDGAVAADLGYRIDLVQAAGYVRQIAPGAMARIESLTGALQGRATLALMGSDYRIGARVEKSDAVLQLKDIAAPVRLARTSLEVDPSGIKVTDTAASIPTAEVVVSSAQYTFKGGSGAAAADFDVDVAKTLEVLRNPLQPPVGRARGSARVAFTPKTVNVGRVVVEYLDSKVTASAQLSDFATGPRVKGAVSDALISARLLDWVWRIGALPPSLEVKAPVRAAVPRLAWSPKGFELQATAQVDRGPALTADLAWSPELLEVRRASIKDRMSDVAVNLRSRERVIEGRYAGTLDGRSISALLANAGAHAGTIGGDLSFTFDRAQPRRTTAQGTLNAQNLDLSWLAGKPAKLEHMDLLADGAGIHVKDATVEWAGQRATLRAETKRGDDGPVVDAQIESPGVVVDALLPPKGEKASRGPSDPLRGVFPLPVTGRVALRSKFIQYGNLKVEPVNAVLTAQSQSAKLEVNEAFLCGLAVPATLEATPAGFAARVNIAAENQKLEDAAKCLSAEEVVITGPLDLRASLRTQGQPAEFLQNLSGTVSADVRNGEMKKFALIGNILSMQNVVSLVQQGGAHLGANSFPFRQLSAKGRFEKGRFVIDEGVFHSNAVGLGANGWISLSDFQTRLTVLVAPLALVDEAVRKLPVLGYVVGGTFTSLPVSVSGDIRDPTVVPLGPRAITSELTGILGRTLSLPGKLVPGE